MKTLYPTLPVALLYLLVHSSSAIAQITTDGSLGAATTLAGPNYQVNAALGRIAGNNLFHSFGTFSLTAGESATFTGPVSIGNVISRVTGGLPSSIDGAILDNFAQANFYFLNPAGVMFGPNASLNVSGSFFVSSADYIRLADGRRFLSLPSAEDVNLTSAAPEAFGFFDANNAAVDIQGSALGVSTGNSIAIVAGNITITGGQLQASEGDIQLLSSAAAGDVIIAANCLDGSQISQFGQVQISGSSLDTSGAQGGGDIYIRGGELVVDGSSVSAHTLGTGDAGSIDLQGDNVTITNGAYLSTEAAGPGNGGNMSVNGNTVSITNNAFLVSSTYANGHSGAIAIQANALSLDNGAGIVTATQGLGDAGNVDLNAAVINLDHGARIHTASEGAGSGGDVTLQADSITLDNSAAINTGTYATAMDAGDIAVTANSLTLLHGAELRTQSLTPGDAGTINLHLRDALTLQGQNPGGTTSRLVASSGNRAVTGLSGNAGDITITATDVSIADGSLVLARTYGTGNAGSISLQTSGSVAITGVNNHPNVRERSAVSTESLMMAGGLGDGGAITISADSLTIADGGFISSDAGIGASAVYGAANAGDITLYVAGDMRMEGIGQFSGVPVESAIRANAVDGQGGAITINAGNLTVADGAQIQSAIFGAGRGGDISLTVQQSLQLLGGNPVTGFATGLYAISTPFASGQAGDITIRAGTMTLQDGAVVWSNAFGPGAGGDITLDIGDTLTLTGNMQGPGFPNNGSGSQIASYSDISGNGGDIVIAANRIAIDDGARILSTTTGTGDAGDITISATAMSIAGADATGNLNPSGLFAKTLASGNGGDIRVSVAQLSITDGAEVSSSSTGTGLAGDIYVDASNWITLHSGASISATSASADGGNITVNAINRLWLKNASISTSVGGGDGTGGNISIDPIFVIMDSSVIRANAFGGRGGNVSIAAGHFIASPSSVVEAVAKSSTGIDGTVVIDSPDRDISDRLQRTSLDYDSYASTFTSQCSSSTLDSLVRLQIGPPHMSSSRLPQALRAPVFHSADSADSEPGSDIQADLAALNNNYLCLRDL